ncbi:hypothetical protein ABEB36_005781 [Hypothenemus hampei]|uniref:Major facilitator superfamily (MFS) profile domain-containing protein n=1 Tax=Hypothenemus hampei TaxID=57062 RepID=A0ABD1EZE3_HYPHA
MIGTHVFSLAETLGPKIQFSRSQKRLGECSLKCHSNALSINLICFSTGTAYSWTSPLIPKFKSSNQLINPIGRPLTPEESGLLVSLINLGLFCGPIVCGFIVGKFGKKSVILFTSLPLLLAHILCSFAKSFELFLVARILMGFTSGAEWAVIPGYLSEISDPKNRGLLNTLMMVASCLGCLFTYVVGPYVSVTWFSIFNLIPTILFFGLVYFLVPDSPYDLLTKKDVKAAKESLMKLKQTNDVRKDLLEIESILEENSKNHAGFRDIFKNRGAVNALFICSMLMIFNALAGTIIVLSYTQSILDLMGESIPSAELAIIVGSVSFLATLINCQLVDRLGRKPVIMLSCLIGSLSHASLGIFFHLQNSGLNIEKIKYLPICSVMIFMFSFYFGLAQAPYVILGELFSPKIKAVASTICTSLNFGLAFIITLIYPYAIATVGIGNTFLFFSLMLAICVIFCGLKLPETKGKTFQEIYVLLDRGANNQILKE